MKINELSAKSGIHAETVRYYEKTGLLPTPKRAANGYRVYDEGTLGLLAFIKTCRSLGFSIEDIRELNRLKHAPAEHHRADAMVRAQLDNVEDKIAQLEDIRKFLLGLMGEEGHGPAECRTLAGLGGG
ncbi:MerR family transcriptional regulator [Eikenella sp. S3360]|uniref:MerR family transcriptional regulator n=1 Tax=Eikenella glucosivorans TaxID=2766967 RepID=A0ABS0NDN6_9NEIS|nr:MerR family transcriptional regulator [Eikenella glucosivorans]MBH5330372.1 MerR family transcriptional regulator [Eikenella glucosivorans]